MTTTVRSRGGRGAGYYPPPRRNLNRSRSGDGLKLLRKGKRPLGGKSSQTKVVVFVALIILVVVVATVHTTLQSNPQALQNLSIRRRRRTDDRNVDDFVDAGEQAEEQAEDKGEPYGGKFGEEEQQQQQEKEPQSAKEEDPIVEDEEEDPILENEQFASREEEHRRKMEELQRKEEELQRREEELRRAEEERQKQERQRRQEEEEEAERKKMVEQEEKQRMEAERIRLEEQVKAERLRLEQEAQAQKQQKEQDAKHHQHHARVAAPVPKQDEIPSEQPALSFCEFMRKKTGSFYTDVAASHGYSNPAMLILGMEDLSTDLVWHVLTQIMFPNRPTTPKRTAQLVHQATAIDYSLLDKPNTELQGEFWKKVSDKSRGKWLVHVFCQQQEHGLAMGFPWLTDPAGMIAGNHKAKDTLELIKTLPKGSVKIIRVKRNLLDAVIRQSQRNAETKAPEQQQQQHTHAYHMKEMVPVNLDHHKIFHQLHRLQNEQDQLDDFLRTYNVPHLTVDFESIFPFKHWTDLVQVTQQAQESGTTQLTTAAAFEDEGNNLSPMESEWRNILRYLDITDNNKNKKPLTMFDILQDTMRTHKVNTFWTQTDAVKNWNYVANALMGTHYQHVLRKYPEKQVWGDNNNNNNRDEM
ncbi:expressed unknown protein [Seminavis robusta]|uniref:Uncharacterized protein n=1 Tax=Seminavis robusta TaxID=568900 RepID=A0A9N8H3W8_9STRA|nr:expressed unknown protein [Seminavis robusta]|eukprot:Sro47_g028020.1 n/a (639) ;mRNA; r:145728-147644